MSIIRTSLEGGCVNKPRVVDLMMIYIIVVGLIIWVRTSKTSAVARGLGKVTSRGVFGLFPVGAVIAQETLITGEL